MDDFEKILEELGIMDQKNKLGLLTDEEVQKIYDAAGNIRDQFFIKLLLESGMTAKEALTLQVDDLILDHNNGHRIRLRKKKGLFKEIKVSQALMDAFDDYAYEVLDELEETPSFVFVKLSGKYKGDPMSYTDINQFFGKIKLKTGLSVNVNSLRKKSILK